MKTTILILALLLQGAVSFAQDAKQLIREGVVLHDQGKYKEAIKKYEAALVVDENNITAMTEKAMTLYYLKEYDKGVEMCKTIIEIHPGAEELKLLYPIYANTLDEAGKPEEAVEVYNEGIELFPDYNQLHFNKGVTLSGLKKYDEALLSFEESARLNPQHASSHSAVARLQTMQKNSIPALMAFCRFSVIEPTGSRAQSNLLFIDQTMNGSATRTGKNEITINLDASILVSEEGDSAVIENDFTSTNMILALSAALGMEDDKKKAAESFNDRMNTVCSSLTETQEGSAGFYWEYYAPYFIEMKKEGHLEALSYIVYSASGEKYVMKWLKKNQDKVEAFYNWSMFYIWDKEYT
jgi:tetratricopeptide (TPR) repeat protein